MTLDDARAARCCSRPAARPLLAHRRAAVDEPVGAAPQRDRLAHPGRHRNDLRDGRRRARRRRSAATTTSPPKSTRLPRVGGAARSDVERILAIKPDLVDRLRDADGADERLDRAGIPYYQLPAPGAARHHDDDPGDRRADRLGGAGRRGRVGDGTSARRRSARGRRAAAARGRCWCSSATRRRCATSTPAAATDSCTTCSRSPAAATSSPTSSSRRCRRAPRWCSRAQPEVIIELRYGDSLKNADIAKELRAWNALASVPAVTHRTASPRSTGDEFVVPGPRVVDADAQAGARRCIPDVVQMKTLVSWSSGKDSAWMVHVLRQRGDVEIGALLTTINEPAQRVAMHAVRVELLQAQADALGLPLWRCRFRRRARTRSTSARWRAAVARAVAEGFTHVGVRRSVPRGHPALPRGAARRHRPDAAVPAVRRRHRHAARARDDRRRAARAAHLRQSEGARSRASPAASSTRRCSTSCRRRSIRAASAASSTRSPTPARCSPSDRRSTPAITVERDGFVFTDLTIADQSPDDPMTR